MGFAMEAEQVAENDGQPIWFFSGSPKDATAAECPLEPYFTCGFFLFDPTWKRDDLRALVVAMLQRGCVSMMFHGARSGEAHDLADDAFINDGFERNFGGDKDTLMTTWWEGTDLVEAVFNLFCASFPTSGFVNSGYHVFSFGSTGEGAILRLLLSDFRNTVRAAADREAQL
jgi:hypothetical protein